MAFAAGSLEKVSQDTAITGALGRHADRPVSNGSMATVAGCELSECEDSDGTKASWDGSGSTINTAEGGAGDDDKPPKRWNCLVTAGPMASSGSIGHPTTCKPCAFYCFSFIGCRADRDCTYCHLAHISKAKQEREMRAQRKRCSRQKRMHKPPTSAAHRPAAVHRDAHGSLPKIFGDAETSSMIAVLSQTSLPPGLVSASNADLALTLHNVLMAHRPAEADTRGSHHRTAA